MFLGQEGFNGKAVPEINVLLIADFIQGFLGAPVQVKVEFFLFRISGDAFLVVNEFVRHPADLSLHILQVYAHFLVFGNDDSREHVGVSDADLVGVAPYKGLVFRIVENTGFLSKHTLHQGPHTEPLNFPADIFKRVQLGLFHCGQLHHVAEGVVILLNFPDTQVTIGQNLRF